MATNDSRELEPPVTLPSANDADVAVLGRTAFRERNEPFGIRNNDRRRHLAMIGKTGMGKSTLLEQLILSDIEAGRGVGVIDPHGDLADAIVAHIPRNRTNDVVLFDVTDRRFPPAYNPLYCNDPERRALVVSGVVTAFKKLYGDSWGPRLEYILRNALAALMETPGATLLSLQRMLSDVRFRQSILNHVSDEIARSFWLDEFAKKPQRLQEESISPIQNKVGQFLTDPHLRRIVGQPEARINLERVMNDGQVLIANLSKGRIGEDATSLLGSLLVTDLQQSAMHRAELQEEQRRDFYLYVDEFQNFATESFATILSEARKYRLNLTIANQYLDQIEEEGILAAVFGNVGSLLCFQLGSRDAEVLAEQLAGDVAPQDLIGLPQYSAYVRLLIDGMPSKPFSMRTIRPKRHGRPDRITAVRNASRRRYSRPSKSVQREIAIVRTFILHPNTAH